MELIALVSVGLSLVITGANAAFFVICKFNDLVHVQKQLEDMSKNITMIWDKLDKIAERVSNMEGKLSLIEKK